jgi:cellobiose PTS system EIIB component
MKSILLICANGMSTAIIVKKMEEAAKEKNIEVSIKACSIANAPGLIGKADIALLGPQIRFNLKKIQSLNPNIPVYSMDMSSYGLMDGAAILVDAIKKLEG